MCQANLKYFQQSLLNLISKEIYMIFYLLWIFSGVKSFMQMKSTHILLELADIMYLLQHDLVTTSDQTDIIISNVTQ